MIKVEIRDELRQLIDKVTDKWLLEIVETNPSILYMFRDKNVKPRRNLEPWSGEFAGKYLTACAQVYAISGSEALRDYCDKFIKQLISYQEPNGYLGPYDEEHQLTGTNEFYRDPINERVLESEYTWDLWGHYYIMCGLLRWGEILGKAEIYETVYRIADLLMDKFYGEDGKRMVDIGWPEMNLTPYHAFAILYNKTGKRKYLDFARKIELDTEDERAGNYMKYALEGIDYYKCPKPRWESMHIIMGYAEMYRATGETKYLDTVRQIVYSILKTDVHNTGAFSTNEQAIGNPYKSGCVETCCVVAFNALVAELNSLEPSVHLADFLERSLYNAIMGSFSKSGRWSTYDTPMDGLRRANYDQIVFQSKAGSPDLNCCSANAPRGLSEVCNFAALDKDGITHINYFGRGKYATEAMSYSIDGNYPYDECIMIKFYSDGKVRVRIPEWSKNTELRLDRVPQTAMSGEYCELCVHSGDTLEIKFDFRIRRERGEYDCEGKSCFYRGPILLGLDNGENPNIDFDNPPAITDKMLESAVCKLLESGALEMKLECGITLGDFYSLGQKGNPYRTWLN